MKFGTSSGSHSSSDSSDSHSSSDSSSSHSSSSDSSDSHSSSSSSDSSSSNGEGENVSTSQLTSSEQFDNTSTTINGNNTLSELPQQDSQDSTTTDEQKITQPDLSNPEALANLQTNDSNTLNDKLTQNKTMLMYIGGGSGVVVVAVTGLLIFNKVKSKKSLNDYEFDQRPYNNGNNSMDMSQPSLLNGNLAPATLYGFPDNNNNNNFNNGTFKSGQYNFSSNYNAPNNGSLHITPPAMNYGSYNNVNKNNGFFNDYQQDSKRNTYEMISPYDPTETSYQNYNYNFNDNLVLDNNGMINVNSNNPYMNVGVDVGMKRSLPRSDNYSANPRNGSLPRNKVPENVKAPLMNYNRNENNNRDYRSSILSYISSNRDTFYDAAKAEHSVNHNLLNQICTIAYASQPENDDELYLCVGDKVKILEVYDDGWAYSLHISSGLEGMLPLNCTAEFYQ